MTNEMMQILSRLSLAFGPTGCEEPVADILRELGESLCSRVTTDRSGNIIFSYDPTEVTEKTKTVMVSTHMDEVGFMIHEIDDEGYLRFSVLGDIDPRVLCGRNVKVGNEMGQVCGVIASKAIHHQSAEERAKITDPEDMYIDIGATSKEQAEKRVSVGDFGTFDGLFDAFGAGGSFVRAKALDTRACCAAMLDVMGRLSSGALTSSHRLRFCFTVRGQTGPCGAGLVAARLCPDTAVVLDAGAAADLPGVSAASRSVTLSSGCAIPPVDKKILYAKRLTDLASVLAESKKIPVQIRCHPENGNDAAEIQRRGIGAEVLALSIPMRYPRTASSVICLADVDAASDLLAALLAEPTL